MWGLPELVGREGCGAVARTFKALSGALAKALVTDLAEPLAKALARALALVRTLVFLFSGILIGSFWGA